MLRGQAPKGQTCPPKLAKVRENLDPLIKYSYISFHMLKETDAGDLVDDAAPELRVGLVPDHAVLCARW